MGTIFRNSFASDAFFRAPRFRLGWILIAIAALNAFGWMLVRWSYENSLTSTQLTVDYLDTRTLADAYQRPHLQFLQELKARGVTSIGLYQQSMGNLRDNGRITITPREEAERLYPEADWTILPEYRYVVTASRENQVLLQQILQHIERQSQPKLPPKSLLLQSAPSGPARGIAQFGIAIPASPQLITDAQVGFDPAQVETARKAGLIVTARISNSLNLNLERVQAMLDEAHNIGARVVIFSEDEVVGYESLIREVSREMRNRDLLFGNIEFTKQRGWPDFSKQTEGMIVRVHSVGGDEAAKTKVELLVDRFARAIKERTVRVAYIRMVRQVKGEYSIPPAPAPGQTVEPPKLEKDALQQNLDFVAEVAHELERQPAPAWLRPGLQMGRADAFHNYPLDYLAARAGGERGGERAAKILRYLSLFLTGLGAVGATLLLVNLFFDLSRLAHTLLFLLGVFIVAGLAISPGLGAKAIGLIAGCFMTPVAVLWGGLARLWPTQDGGRGGDGKAEVDVPLRQIFGRACKVLLQTSALTFLGAMMVVAAFNHWKFLSHSDEFVGEKATLLLPLFLIGVAFGGEVFPHRVVVEGARASRRRALERLNMVLAQPFTTRVAGTLLLVAIGGYFFLARSGNDSGIEISSFEWNFRALMERLFLTRPRTKEMIVGNPAMIFAVYFALRRKPILALAAIIVATIGQADILNTFCHFWTPLFYSVLRTVHALWIGALVGGVALVLWNWAERRFLGRRHEPLRPLDSRVEEGPPGNGTARPVNGVPARERSRGGG